MIKVLRRPLDWFLSPSARLLTVHYLSNKLYASSITRPLALLLWNIEVLLFGCYISIKCRVPKSTKFPHPIGIVIGDGVVIGENVTIYQNVTLGIRKLGEFEYPIVNDNAIIYASCVIAGNVCIVEGEVIPALTKVIGERSHREDALKQ